MEGIEQALDGTSDEVPCIINMDSKCSIYSEPLRSVRKGRNEKVRRLVSKVQARKGVTIIQWVKAHDSEPAEGEWKRRQVYNDHADRAAKSALARPGRHPPYS